MVAGNYCYYYYYPVCTENYCPSVCRENKEEARVMISELDTYICQEQIITLQSEKLLLSLTMLTFRKIHIYSL